MRIHSAFTVCLTKMQLKFHKLENRVSIFGNSTGEWRKTPVQSFHEYWLTILLSLTKCIKVFLNVQNSLAYADRLDGYSINVESHTPMKSEKKTDIPSVTEFKLFA